MSDWLTFPTREAFRAWLVENRASSEGVWLLFGKKGGPVTLSANDALEEALCFGWIDGQTQSLDGQTYQKYFALRRANSKWSEKNKALATRLEQQGKMTDSGRAKIAEAKENGQWSKPKPPPATEEQTATLSALLQGYEPAYTNFTVMSSSEKRRICASILTPKQTPDGPAAWRGWWAG